MFERPQLGSRVILVHIDFRQTPETPNLAEFESLCGATDATVVHSITGTRDTPDPKWFVGQGKLDEIQTAIKSYDAECVLFNHDLSPAQERNVERELCCRVLGRTGLILDIFAARARTFEGKLQVELAQLKHLSTRLVRGWTHLERQKGGIGLRGPGETQLETDRRLLRVRITQIEKRLAKVRSQRQLSRRSRERAPLATVSLVGYTNAGKSTLFNALTGADVLVADQLFATLDPTLREWVLPKLGRCILADTVGFIRALPHQLVEAFRSTLEETREAQLLLHVVDASAPDFRETIQTVNETLREIGAESVPQLLVYNKVDLAEVDPHILKDSDGQTTAVWLSATDETGLDLLKSAVVKRLSLEMVFVTLNLAPSQAHLRAALFRCCAIQKENITDVGGWEIDCQLPKVTWEQLCAQYPELRPASAPNQ